MDSAMKKSALTAINKALDNVETLIALFEDYINEAEDSEDRAEEISDASDLANTISEHLDELKAML